MKARTDIEEFTRQLQDEKQRKQARRKIGRTEPAKKPPLVARFLSSSSSSESPVMATPPKRAQVMSAPPAPRKKARAMPPQHGLSPAGLVFAPPTPQRAPVAVVIPAPPVAVVTGAWGALGGKHCDGLMLFGFEAGRFTDMTLAEAAEAFALLPAAKKAKLARRQSEALAGRSAAAEE